MPTVKYNAPHQIAGMQPAQHHHAQSKGRFGVIPKEYQGIRYDDPQLQAEFERLIAQVTAADRARAPFAQQMQEAERARDTGKIDRDQFETTEDKYISANNTIARAKRAVDQFLGEYKNYHVER
jgi:hypothetical protein